MIAGQIQIQRFGYGLGDGNNPKTNMPIKVLAFRDADSQLQVGYVFTPEEFDAFIQTITGNHIVPATELPANIRLIK